MTDREYSAFRYLARLWRIDQEIHDKEEELREIGLVQGVRYDRDNVQTSPSDPMGRVADIIGEIEEGQERYIRLKHQRINEIHGLEDAVYEQYLVDRFIKGWNIRTMTRKYGCHHATTYRTFCRALDAFADKYPERVDMRTNANDTDVK